MKKNVFGRKFKRDKNERKALFTGLMSALILHDRIETTEEKAKAIRPQIEKLITKGMNGSNASLKVISGSLSHNVKEKFLKEVAPRFKNRKGGYTRIIRIGTRLGDQAQMVIMEWTEKAKEVAVVTDSKTKNLKPKTEKAEAKKVTKVKKETKAKKTVKKSK